MTIIKDLYSEVGELKVLIEKYLRDHYGNNNEDEIKEVIEINFKLSIVKEEVDALVDIYDSKLKILKNKRGK